MARDNLYATSRRVVAPFKFDSEVVQVFDDMIGRSVPHYRENFEELVALSLAAAKPGTSVYDLGCSLGAFLIPLARRLKQEGTEGVRLVGVDNSKDMLDGLVARSSGLEIETICQPIQEVEIEKASVVVLNYTLQFVPLEDRKPLLERIANGSRPGSVLLISEKIMGDSQWIDQLYVERHHEFKRRNGYSELEIAQKRQSLENVLVAETLDSHKKRIRAAGYSDVCVWSQFHNFVSLCAVKR